MAVSALDQILGQAAAVLAAEMQSNSAAMVAAAAAENAKAVDSVIAIVVANLPKGGILAVLSPVIAQTLKNAEASIIAALGGEEQALLLAAEAELAAFAKASA